MISNWISSDKERESETTRKRDDLGERLDHPLTQRLLFSLRGDNPRMAAISVDVFERIRCIYQDIAKDLSINDYQDLITIMIARDKRNIVEHEMIGGYLADCEIMKVEPTFEDFLRQSHLTGSLKHKRAAMETLKKIFTYYVKHAQYQIKHQWHEHFLLTFTYLSVYIENVPFVRNRCSHRWKYFVDDRTETSAATRCQSILPRVECFNTLRRKD